MKALLLLAALPATLAPASTGHGGDEPNADFAPGTYGVCGCAGEASGPANLKLTVNEDGTYQYFDGSDPAHRVDERGQWRLEGRKLTLRSDGEERTWSLDKGAPCLRTRFGIRFERLCRLEACD